MATAPGIDTLIRDNFKPLQGLRVGLITNHTGLSAVGHSTIDVLHHAPGVHLSALFGPEHGIRGVLDTKVSDSRDQRTGLPVYSLYGETNRPKPDQLRDLDALVFDIQDVGCRFYTFISTLGNCLEEAGRSKLKYFVLDRPNPIGGIDVQGPVADTDRLTFVAWHPLPVRHGLTVGELATLFNAERRISADLTVIRCEGWKRKDWWDATGLTWVNPSPNMRSLTEATLYPGIGLLEYTNLSVGRGTDTPFEVVGAPWMDSRKLAAELNSRKLRGISFVPVRFTPNASKFQKEACGGINLVITNREQVNPLRVGIEIAVALRKLYPEDWKPEPYDRLLVNRKAMNLLMSGSDASRMEASWREGMDAFAALRRNYLLY